MLQRLYTLLLLLPALLIGNALAGESVAATSDETLFIDVRSEEEYRQGHIEGALLMPHQKIGELITEAGIDRETHITVYCRSGRRAEIARQTLLEKGYTKVSNGGGYSQLRADLDPALDKDRGEDCKAETC